MDLIKLLRTAETVEDIDRCREEIACMIPDVRVMFEYDQSNVYHCYDLWVHSIHTVLNLPGDIPDDMVYLAALIHDIGKPECRVFGGKLGNDGFHYYGHPEKSAEITEQRIIPDLAACGVVLSEDEQRRLLYYVRHHDDHFGTKVKDLREHFREVSLDEFKRLLILQNADSEAHNPVPLITGRMEICSRLLDGLADELYSEFQGRV